jgi:hypothetical protein
VAARAGKWKAIRGGGEALRLYDLSLDVGERRDVAAGHAEVVRRLEAYLERAHREPRPQVEPPRIDGRQFR